MTYFITFLPDLFSVNDIDLEMFSTMTDQDLLSIGIKSFGARKIMLCAMKGELNTKCSVSLFFLMLAKNEPFYLFSER